MQPKTNNNAPPAPRDGTAEIGNDGNGSAGADAINFPDGLTEPKVIDWARQRKSAFTSWVGPFITQQQDYIRQFRNRPDKAAKNPFPLPIASSIVESIAARLTPQILNKPKVIEAICMSDEKDNEGRELVEDFVNQMVLENARRPERGKSLIKDGLITGTMFWKHVWKQEAKKNVKPIYQPDSAHIPMPGPDGMPVPPPMVFAGDNVTETVEEHWDFVPKGLENMIFDPNCVSRINDSTFCAEKDYLSYNQLLRMQQQGLISGIERIKDIIPSGGSQNTRDSFEKQIKEADGDPNFPVVYPDEKAYLVEEWWAELTYQNGEQVEMGKFKFFIVEGKFVIGFEENPLIPERHPYGSCPIGIDPNSVLGLSVLDAVSALQKQINNFGGHQAELVERASRPLILYDSSSGITGRTQFTKMYGLQPVNNVNGLKEMAVDMAPIEIVGKYMEQMIGLAREASGANEQFQGIEGADTATEFQGLQAAAGSRFADVADTIQQGFIEDLAENCYLFYKQFGVDGQMWVRSFVDGLSRPVTRQDLSGDYDFVPAGGSNEQAKGQQIQRAMEAVELGSKMGPTPEGMFNGAKAFKEIILPNLGMKTGADWFVQPPPPMMPPGMPGPPQGGVSPLPPMPQGPPAPGEM